MKADAFAAWLRAFAPAPVAVSCREMLLACLGAGLGIAGACALSHALLGGLVPWFVAPMGASAVLLFAVPASPLAQPWSILGGNVVSALVGVTCAAYIPDVALAAGVGVAAAIGAMFALRCLHPPGGAVALTAVLGGPAIAGLGYRFALWPVGLDSLLLLLTALLFNAAARRRYPHRAAPLRHPHLTRDELPSARLGLTAADLDDALAARGEWLDVSKDDLEQLFLEAEHRAHRRRFGDVRCEEVMSRDVVTVEASTPADEAWRLMLRHSVKALPVLDAGHTLRGIVTMHDFLVGRDAGPPMRASLGIAAPVRVGDLMTDHVLTARPGQPVVDLVAAFSDGGRHHLPVVDEQRRLLGMVTQSDMVGALFRAGLERPAAGVSARAQRDSMDPEPATLRETSCGWPL